MKFKMQNVFFIALHHQNISKPFIFYAQPQLASGFDINQPSNETLSISISIYIQNICESGSKINFM